jgi:hypothetical protein
MFERQIVVIFDDSGVCAAFPSGKIESIEWTEIERIVVETNDTGPWGADFWWVLDGRHARCTFPLGATGEPEALKQLRARFPSFDEDAVGDACRSTSNARFVCWAGS